MGRPRPRVEGRTSARFANQSIQSDAPKDARLVPEKLSTLDNPRALAARRMLGTSNTANIARRTGLRDACGVEHD